MGRAEWIGPSAASCPGTSARTASKTSGCSAMNSSMVMRCVRDVLAHALSARTPPYPGRVVVVRGRPGGGVARLHQPQDVEVVRRLRFEGFAAPKAGDKVSNGLGKRGLVGIQRIKGD